MKGKKKKKKKKKTKNMHKECKAMVYEILL